MIKSMTGFGRCENIKEKRKLAVEIRAVNHRYLDISVKMPKKLSHLESNVRTILKDYAQRGKVDVYVAYEDTLDTAFALHYNETLAGEYMRYFQQMAQKFSLEKDISVSTLARMPEVFTMTEQDADDTQLAALLEETVHSAAKQFVASRVAEGERLKEDMLGKLERMLANVDYIEERSPQVIAAYRQMLETKVRELLDNKQLDESRLIMEVTLFADKICVDEETVRLRSHIEAVRDALLDGGSVGRKLDFIAQEMNREANTILSKANDSSISDAGIELKTSIEKIREQIQNIE